MDSPRPDPLFVDPSAARRVEALYRTADITAQRAAMLEMLALRPGGRVIDVGCGPGLLAASMAEQVGPGGQVLGVDSAEAMIAIAGANCAAHPQVRVTLADATALPAADGGADALTCIQVLEYVPDVAAALAEFRRVLRKGGKLLVMDTDWTSCLWASADDARMKRILSAWDGHCAHPHLPRRLGGLLAAAGFEAVRLTALPLLALGSGAGTYSAGMIEVIGRFAARSAGIPHEEVDAWREDLARHDAENRSFFSLNRFLFSATRA